MASFTVEPQAREGAQATVTLDLLQTGSTSSPVVPELTYDTTLLTLQGAIALSNSHYTLTFRSRSDLAPAKYAGTIRFRLCQETACTNVHPNTTHTLSYNIEVTLGDWLTFQRDVAHTGYVKVSVKPSAITKIWEVRLMADRGYVGLSRVAADTSKVYVSGYFFPGGRLPIGFVFGLDAKNPATYWSATLDPVLNIGDPAIANGKVFVAPTFQNGVNQMKTYDAATGAQLSESAFDSQGGEVGTPLPIGSEVYIAPGFFAADVYSYEQTGGALRWRTRAPGDRHAHFETPAGDADQVYHYTGTTLNVYRRSDGIRTASITDPHVVNDTGRYYLGAPILLPDKSVIAYSGPSGNARFLERSNTHRPIVKFITTTGAVAWKTADTYVGTPALRNDLLFVARNGPPRLDAIRVADGGVAWSWTPPDGADFIANIVVTDNLLFVSTTANTYAVDLATRAVVWTYDEPGELAIGPGNLLLISEMEGGPVYFSSGDLSAFQLDGSGSGPVPASSDKGVASRKDAFAVLDLDADRLAADATR